MRCANNGSLGDFWMCDEGAFDFGCSHPVAGHVDNIIHATCDPIIPIFVTSAAITCEVLAMIGREICKLEAVMVTVNGSHLTRPAIGKA